MGRGVGAGKGYGLCVVEWFVLTGGGSDVAVRTRCHGECAALYTCRAYITVSCIHDAC